MRTLTRLYFLASLLTSSSFFLSSVPHRSLIPSRSVLYPFWKKRNKSFSFLSPQLLSSVVYSEFASRSSSKFLSSQNSLASTKFALRFSSETLLSSRLWILSKYFSVNRSPSFQPCNLIPRSLPHALPLLYFPLNYSTLRRKNRFHYLCSGTADTTSALTKNTNNLSFSRENKSAGNIICKTMEDTKDKDQEIKTRPILEEQETSFLAPIYEKGCGNRVRLAALICGENAKEKYLHKVVRVCGWSRSVRKQGGGNFCFIILSDGSTPLNLQIIVEKTIEKNYEELLKCGTGCSFAITGEIVESPSKGQALEMKVNDQSKGHNLEIYGHCDGSRYPLAKKNHTKEYLREIAHLRPRTNLIGAVTRIRSALSMATHRFFQERGFLYVHTPIITASDCEGAGEMFQVTTLMPEEYNEKEMRKKEKEHEKKEKHNENTSEKREDSLTSCRNIYHPRENQLLSAIPVTKRNTIDYARDFFSRQAFLTVSGQLSVEPYCCSLGDVYTFGPTFRAENSHTSRHLAEFWMIEPEISFADLFDNMSIAEKYIKYCVQYCVDNAYQDLIWFENNVEKGLIQRLKNIINTQFHRITYTDAIQILQEKELLFKSDPEQFNQDFPSDTNLTDDTITDHTDNHDQKTKELFKEQVEWGMDLGSEHERFLTEKIFQKPVIVYNYPAAIKAFYMKLNDDGKTVKAMDVLVPKIGELVGGSQREDNLERLDKMIRDKDLNIDSYWWYRELREYGTIPHSGFGLGFERIIMLVTGVENIRDTIPYPRYPAHAEF